MIALVLLTTIGTVPRDYVLTDSADVLELNHYHTVDLEQDLLTLEWKPVSRHILTQLMGRRQVGEHDEIQWWILVGHSKKQCWGPFRDYNRGGWYYIIQKPSQPMIVIRAPSYIETWTSIDREMDERKHYPRELRHGLPSFSQPDKHLSHDN